MNDKIVDLMKAALVFKGMAPAAAQATATANAAAARAAIQAAGGARNHKAGVDALEAFVLTLLPS